MGCIRVYKSVYMYRGARMTWCSFFISFVTKASLFFLKSNLISGVRLPGPQCFPSFCHPSSLLLLLLPPLSSSSLSSSSLTSTL